MSEPNFQALGADLVGALSGDDRERAANVLATCLKSCYLHGWRDGCGGGMDLHDQYAASIAAGVEASDSGWGWGSAEVADYANKCADVCVKLSLARKAKAAEVPT